MRSGFASLAVLGAVLLGAVACSATSPHPLPPRRTAFGSTVSPPIVPPPDLPVPTRAPLRHERYLYWTLPADLLSIVPLTRWMTHPDDLYLPLPSLLIPPLIHLAYGEPQSAAISFVMRGAMVGAVYLAGRTLEQECRDDDFVCVPTRPLVLMQLAVVPVVVIDSLLLARRVREDSSWQRLPVIPSVSAGPNGAVSLTIGSQF